MGLVNDQEIKKFKKLYFMGAGGTGMASVAGLFHELGYEVRGSDENLYPPTKGMLEAMRLEIATPYKVENIPKDPGYLFVIANVLSRGHPELEAILASDRPYTSFAQLLGSFLESKQSVVVCGTHGKTTTTSLIAHVLCMLGQDPGMLVGGMPRNFERSFRVGAGDLFVVEGDEYDTAFFDKGSKFLHYRPRYVVLNNIEYDHADIFPDYSAVERAFEGLLKLVPNPRNIVANIDDPGVLKLITTLGLDKSVTAVASGGRFQPAAVRLTETWPGKSSERWRASFATRSWGTLVIETQLKGHYNIANIAQMLGTLECLVANGVFAKPPPAEELLQAIASFEGVRRRLDLLGQGSGVSVYEDFSHHPTAIGGVIDAFCAGQKNIGRLMVAFEPKSSIARRRVMLADYVAQLSKADLVLIGPPTQDLRIKAEERMDVKELAERIGAKAHAFASNEDLYAWALKELKPGDDVIFFSTGSFSGIQHRIHNALRNSQASLTNG